MKKLIIAVSAALIFAFCVMSVSAFDDMPNDWSTKALQSAVDNGLLTGSDNKLLPKDKLTRAQMATILVRALGATETADISAFTDVPKTAWYHGYMATAYKMGLFKGDGAGKMNPDAAISRQEAFVVLARAFNLKTNSPASIDKFNDGDKVAAWAKPEIAALVDNGYVSGSGGMLNPLSSITRAEFAQVMYNLNKAYVDDQADLDALGTVEGNVIIRGNAVNTIQNVTINGDLIIGDGMPQNMSFKNVNITGRLVIRTTGNLSFDGSVKELVITFDNTTVTKSAASTINAITKDASFANAFVKTEGDSGAGDVGGGTVGGGSVGGGSTGGGSVGGGSVGGGVVTPPVVTPEKDEDIWTEFH